MSGIDDIESCARFAKKLAAAAARESLARFRRPIAVENKGAGGLFDPVTAADREAERAMRALIEETFPDHGIRGEEFPDRPSRSGPYWVLDPIDGTRAFLAGLPSWGTLIALNDGERPVLGLVSQPYIGETFLGISAGPVRHATLNGTAIRTRACGGLARAHLATTDPKLFDETERNRYCKVERQAALVRYGFDCYAYAVLAAGHIDIVIEAGLAPHDVQALIPLVEGAGGRLTGWRGEDAQEGGRILAAGDARLHEEVRRILDED